MNLYNLKSKIDKVVKAYKQLDTDPKTIEVSISTNDIEFGSPKVPLTDISVGFDWDNNHLILSTDEKIYKNTNIVGERMHYMDKYCFAPCQDETKCDCIKRDSLKNAIEVYGIYVNGELTLPLYIGEAIGKVGLLTLVEKFNKEVDMKNDFLNYDKYYDFQKVNDKYFIGGKDKEDRITLKLVPSTSIFNNNTPSPY